MANEPRIIGETAAPSEAARTGSDPDLGGTPRFPPVVVEPEFGGRDGPEPTRFGDWEKNGRCIDF